MEEDINILDEVVGRSKELREKDFGMLIGTKQMQSIEHLIKGYRELEEQLKIDKSYGLEKAELQKEAGCKMLKCKIVDKNIRLNLEIINLKKNYIPKSKVDEKIEKYKKLGNEFYEKFLETNKTDMDIHDAGISCDAKVQVLQELMEDK